MKSKIFISHTYLIITKVIPFKTFSPNGLVSEIVEDSRNGKCGNATFPYMDILGRFTYIFVSLTIRPLRASSSLVLYPMLLLFELIEWYPKWL